MGCSGVAQLNPIAHEVCLSSSRLISQVYKCCLLGAEVQND